MTELDLRNQLTEALIRIGIDQSLIRFDYVIGKHIIVDCIVLSCDGRTPAICFEVKPIVTSAPLERKYQVLSRIYREQIGVDVCYLACLAEIDGKTLPVLRIRENAIRLDSDANTLRMLLGKERVDIAIALENRSNTASIHSLKVIARRVAIVMLLTFVSLDVLETFLLTREHLIFILAIMGLLVVPYVVDVLLAYPRFFDRLIKLSEKILGK